jgi:hypothetical protein
MRRAQGLNDRRAPPCMNTYVQPAHPVFCVGQRVLRQGGSGLSVDWDSPLLPCAGTLLSDGATV